jgi:hypothetical protein
VLALGTGACEGRLRSGGVFRLQEKSTIDKAARRTDLGSW